MPAMKLTPNAAMRARDVSRPHAEHLAQAEAVEASIARTSPGDAARAGRARGGPGEAGGLEASEPPADAMPETAGDRPARAGFPRRRRGPRDRGRRGR